VSWVSYEKGKKAEASTYTLFLFYFIIIYLLILLFPLFDPKMALKYDAEFAQAAGFLLSKLQQAPSLPPHDVLSRRVTLHALIHGELDKIPFDESISRQELRFASFDNRVISVHRYWRKNGSISGSAFLHIHGGGFILGSVEMSDKGLRQLVKESGVQIFSVEYRLAPENPHPAPVEDCFAALRWIYGHANEFCIDKTRIGVFGESAGGGLAAATALLARHRNLMPPLAKQILIYPMLDDHNVNVIDELDELATWRSVDNLTAWTALLGGRRGTADVSEYAAPIRAKDLKGVPPTYIGVGELDIFRDECQRYAQRLREDGVELEFHLYPGLPHLFEIFAPHIQPTKRALESRARAIKSI
jgi:acetyl esterase/lipase